MEYRVDFDSLPWEMPAPGIRQKSIIHGSRRMRLVELPSGYTETDWCTKGHAGYVLDGEMHLTLKDGSTVTYRRGDGMFIPAGAEHKHKPTVISKTFRIVVVEDM